jgi:hypothetical protein
MCAPSPLREAQLAGGVRLQRPARVPTPLFPFLTEPLGYDVDCFPQFALIRPGLLQELRHVVGAGRLTVRTVRPAG